MLYTTDLHLDRPHRSHDMNIHKTEFIISLPPENEWPLILTIILHSLSPLKSSILHTGKLCSTLLNQSHPVPVSFSFLTYHRPLLLLCSIICPTSPSLAAIPGGLTEDVSASICAPPKPHRDQFSKVQIKSHHHFPAWSPPGSYHSCGPPELLVYKPREKSNKYHQPPPQENAQHLNFHTQVRWYKRLPVSFH